MLAGRTGFLAIDYLKTLKRYEAIFAIYLQMMKRDEYAKVHYVCPDASFAPRLVRMFELSKSVLVAGERVPITEKHRASYPVYALDNWPNDYLAVIIYTKYNKMATKITIR